jgi:hypothetical protein
MSLKDITATGTKETSTLNTNGKTVSFSEKEEKLPKSLYTNDAMDTFKLQMDEIKTNLHIDTDNKTKTMFTEKKEEKETPKKTRGRPKKEIVAQTHVQNNNKNNNNNTTLFKSNTNSEYINEVFEPIEKQTKEYTSKFGNKFNKRGALKKDVKWAVETLTGARRQLSNEEQYKVNLATEINRYYSEFSHELSSLNNNLNKGKPKDISKVSLKDLEDEKKEIKRSLADPHTYSLTEEIFFGGVKLFESIYMRRFYGTEHDFLKINIDGLSEYLAGNPDYVRPELRELAIEYGKYLSLSPSNRLIIKTCKAAGECHMHNLSRKVDVSKITRDYEKL